MTLKERRKLLDKFRLQQTLDIDPGCENCASWANWKQGVPAWECVNFYLILYLDKKIVGIINNEGINMLRTRQKIQNFVNISDNLHYWCPRFRRR